MHISFLKEAIAFPFDRVAVLFILSYLHYVGWSCIKIPWPCKLTLLLVIILLPCKPTYWPLLQKISLLTSLVKDLLTISLALDLLTWMTLIVIGACVAAIYGWLILPPSSCLSSRFFHNTLLVNSGRKNIKVYLLKTCEHRKLNFFFYPFTCNKSISLCLLVNSLLMVML